MTPYDVLTYAGLFLGGAVFGIFVGYFGLRARMPPWIRAVLGAKTLAMIVGEGRSVEFTALEFKAPGIALAKGRAHVVIIPPGTAPLHIRQGGELYVAAESTTHYSYAVSGLDKNEVIAMRILPATCNAGSSLADPHCLDELAKVLGQVSKTLPVGPISVSLAADWRHIRNLVRSRAAQLLASAITAVANTARARDEAKSLIVEMAKLSKAQIGNMMKWLVVIIIIVVIAFGILSILVRGSP